MTPDPSLLVSAAGAIAGWLNLGRGAISSQPDFRLLIDPLQGEAIQGAPAMTEVTVESINKVISRYIYKVILAVNKELPDFKVSFARNSEEPTYYSLITIMVDQNAQVGNHEIAIKGIGADGKEHICKYKLTVLPDSLKIKSRSPLRPIQVDLPIQKDMSIQTNAQI